MSHLYSSEANGVRIAPTLQGLSACFVQCRGETQNLPEPPLTQQTAFPPRSRTVPDGLTSRAELRTLLWV